MKNLLFSFAKSKDSGLSEGNRTIWGEFAKVLEEVPQRLEGEERKEATERIAIKLYEAVQEHYRSTERETNESRDKALR